MPNFLATRSTAPDVGIDRATPESPFFKYGIWQALAAITAKLSQGVTKKAFRPSTMFRSPSPSNAAPKSWSPLRIDMIRCCAHFKFGSGCRPPKSGLGMLFETDSLQRLRIHIFLIFFIMIFSQKTRKKVNRNLCLD